MQPDEQPPVEYVSYNGLGRSPTIWGIPYMFGLFLAAGSLMVAMLCGLFFGPAGWLVFFLAVPILLFVKVVSATDDRALSILRLELKWTLLKLLGGNSKYYGGTLTITPTTYGRRSKDVQRYFKTPSGR